MKTKLLSICLLSLIPFLLSGCETLKKSAYNVHGYLEPEIAEIIELEDTTFEIRHKKKFSKFLIFESSITGTITEMIIDSFSLGIIDHEQPEDLYYKIAEEFLKKNQNKNCKINNMIYLQNTGYEFFYSCD